MGSAAPPALLAAGTHLWDLILLAVRVGELNLLWRHLHCPVEEDGWMDGRALVNKSNKDSKAPFPYHPGDSTATFVLVTWWHWDSIGDFKEARRTCAGAVITTVEIWEGSGHSDHRPTLSPPCL